MTINIEIYDAYTNLYLQVTHPSEHNNEQQQAHYNKIVKIVDEVGYKNKWGKNSINWYNIIEDSIKDMKNNFIGIGNGLSYSDINQCSHILPQNARKRLY